MKTSYIVPMIIFLAILIFVYLRFGSPQSSKYAYIFQAYISPKYEGGIILPPEAYSGNCQMWYSNGNIMIDSLYDDGKLEGDYSLWDEHGGHDYTKYYFHGTLIKIKYLGGGWRYEDGYSISNDPDPEVAKNNVK